MTKKNIKNFVIGFAQYILLFVVVCSLGVLLTYLSPKALAVIVLLFVGAIGGFLRVYLKL